MVISSTLGWMYGVQIRSFSLLESVWDISSCARVLVQL